jgi:hypothetical protein
MASFASIHTFVQTLCDRSEQALGGIVRATTTTAAELIASVFYRSNDRFNGIKKELVACAFTGTNTSNIEIQLTSYGQAVSHHHTYQNGSIDLNHARSSRADHGDQQWRQELHQDKIDRNTTARRSFPYELGGGLHATLVTLTNGHDLYSENLYCLPFLASPSV